MGHLGRAQHTSLIVLTCPMLKTFKEAITVTQLLASQPLDLCKEILYFFGHMNL